MATVIDFSGGSVQALQESAPPLMNMTMRGRGWSTMATSAVAALVVRPTTVAALEIWNGESAGGACYIVDRLFAFNLVSTAVNSAAGIWAMVTAPKAAPSSASLTFSPLNGRSAAYGAINGIGGKAVNAVGTTVVANGWFPYGPQYTAPNAAAPGGSWEANVYGRLIVPPGCSLCITVVGSIVGDTYQTGAAWYEEILTLQ